MDKLTVTGIGPNVDGPYDCDLTGILVDVSSPDALLVSEAETIKRLSGARGFEVAEAFLAGDWTVRMAVALVVLARHGVRLTEQQGWDAKVGAFTFELQDAEEDDAGNPPGEGETPSESGGASGSPTSDVPQASDPAATGHLKSVAS
jgi:hypothetical protein